MVLELLHYSIKLFLEKLEVVAVHRMSLIKNGNFLFEGPDLFDIVVIGEVIIKSDGQAAKSLISLVKIFFERHIKNVSQITIFTFVEGL